MPFLAGLDIETTGLDQSTGHRIIEVALLSYDLHTRELVDRYVQRIDPERPIDPKAQAVHGISYAELAGQPKWEAIAPHLARRLAGCDYVIIHNRQFDEPFVTAELARVGLTFGPAGTYCTMENGRWATMDGKSPRLQELCFSLGIPYDAMLAHAAEYDVDRMVECFWRGLDRGFYRLPDLKKAA
jgi:DNA polymerase-3 subunit epsilon